MKAAGYASEGLINPLKPYTLNKMKHLNSHSKQAEKEICIEKYVSMPVN